jgi:hypothetical protein
MTTDSAIQWRTDFLLSLELEILLLDSMILVLASHFNSPLAAVCVGAGEACAEECEQHDRLQRTT